MDSLLVLVYTSLCVFTSTYIIKVTDGPFDIFWNIRRWFGVKWDWDEDNIVEWADDTTGFFGCLIMCWMCLATWFSVFWNVLAVFMLSLPVSVLIFHILGAVAISAILKRGVDGTL